MKVAIHQPNYLPSLAFFDKMKMADLFVYLDDVQFERNGYTNRSKQSDGKWLTIPIKHPTQIPINRIVIDSGSEDDDFYNKWMRKHVSYVSDHYDSYGREPKPSVMFSDMLIQCIDYFLCQTNINLIEKIKNRLQIRTKTIRSSELGIKSKGSDRILDICRTLNADTYISGSGGKKYMNMEDFSTNDIDVVFPEFEHTPILDVLF